MDVCGEPFIGHVLRLLASQDYRRIVLCTGHLGGDISAYVGDGSRFGVHVQYSHDGPTPLGTGGSLRKAAPLLGPDFMVLYGDSYLDCDFAAIQNDYVAADCLGLMAVCLPPKGYYPNVQYVSYRVMRYDKTTRHPDMSHIDYGLGVLDQGALSFLPDGPYDLADLYHSLADNDELAGYEVDHRFHTIGTPAGLAETEQFLSEHMP